MKVKPYKQEVIELILQFLQKQMGQAQIAKQLRQKHIKELPSWVLNNNQLISKGLTKIIKSFVQMDKKIKQYYVDRKPQSQNQSSHQMQEQPPKSKPKQKKQRKVSTNSVQKNQKPEKKKKDQIAKLNNQHHQNTSGWVKSKFQAPKKLEQIGKDDPKVVQNVKRPSMVARQASSQQSSQRPLHSDHSSGSQKPKNKISKKTTSKKPKQVSQSQSQSSEQQQKPKKPAIAQKSKKQAKQQKKQEKQKQKEKLAEKNDKKAQKQKHKQVDQQAHKTHVMHTRLDDKKQHEHEQEEQQGQGDQQKETNKNGYRKGFVSSFSRIKVDQVGPIKHQLKDNSFQAKFKYGKGGDEWGKYGHEKLKDTKGQSFKKTKDKLKNKAFQGAGNIDFNTINSIPIQ